MALLKHVGRHHSKEPVEVKEVKDHCISNVKKCNKKKGKGHTENNIMHGFPSLFQEKVFK